tara:strand:+ start:225 stop:905 length:681 start_codon:yes stop_codon:yes gene_type:complete
MNIYSYSRTSTLEHIYTGRDSELSLETELLAIQTYCLQRNWYLSETLRDKEVDWGVQFKDRENGSRLISLLSAGDKVICSHLERLVSCSLEAVELVEFFRSLHVQLHIVELGGDITREDFSLEFAKAAELFSNLDKKKSAERIKSVKQKQRNKGRYLGGSRPFGYMVHENGKLIENPLEQRLLRKILELKRAGNSLRSISDAVSTPLAPVSFKTVQRLLQRHADRL